MNTLERIEAALTPSSIFNEKDHVWRSIDMVLTFSGLQSEEELLSVLNGGDLDRKVVYRISKKGEKKLMVAFQDQAEMEKLAAQLEAGNDVAPESSDLGEPPMEDLTETIGASSVGEAVGLGQEIDEAQQEAAAEGPPNPCAEIDLSAFDVEADADGCDCDEETCPVKCDACGTGC